MSGGAEDIHRPSRPDFDNLAEDSVNFVGLSDLGLVVFFIHHTYTIGPHPGTLNPLSKSESAGLI